MRTLYVEFNSKGFWVYDVVSSSFLKYLIDAAEQLKSQESYEWLGEDLESWRINIIVSEFGFHLDEDWSQSRINTICELCRTAIKAIHIVGDIPSSELLLDGHFIDTRSHEIIPAKPIIRFGEAIIDLLTDSLAKPPDGHLWYFNLESDLSTMKPIKMA